MLKHFLAALLVAAGLVGSWSAAQAAPVYLDPVSNLEWRQVKDTVNFSFNQMNKDTNGQTWGCSAATGVCSGNLGGSGTSLNGWRWATELEVRTLFHNFAGSLNISAFDPLPSTPTDYAEINSTWAPAFIDRDGAGADAGIFDATFLSGTADYSFGFTRTTDAAGDVLAGYVQNTSSTAQFDIVNTSGTFSPDQRDTNRGFWLLRGEAATAAIPSPTTTLLLATGVAVLGWHRRPSRASL